MIAVKPKPESTSRQQTNKKRDDVARFRAWRINFKRLFFVCRIRAARKRRAKLFRVRCSCVDERCVCLAARFFQTERDGFFQFQFAPLLVKVGESGFVHFGFEFGKVSVAEAAVGGFCLEAD